MMGCLFDTDICSAHLHNPRILTNRLSQNAGQLYLFVLTMGELLSWTLRRKTPSKYHQELRKLLADVTVLDVDQSAARKCGDVRAQ